MTLVKGPRSIRFRLAIWETTLLFQIIEQKFIVPKDIISSHGACDFPDGNVFCEEHPNITLIDADKEEPVRIGINGWMKSNPPEVCSYTLKTPGDAMRFKILVLRELYKAFVSKFIMDGEINYNDTYFLFQNSEEEDAWKYYESEE